MKRLLARFYFAFRSPYSWIGARLLEARFPDAYIQMEYIPFWDPDDHSLALLHNLGGEYLYTPMSKAKHLYILLDIKRLTTRLGYVMKWPIDANPWWDLPNLAYLRAGHLGKGHAFLRAAYRARWERGENIFTEEAICRLAAEVALDADLLLAAVDDEEVRAEAAAMLYRAYQDDVFGVPYYKVGHQRFWGIDRFEAFASCFDAILESS